jgi:N-acetylglutamate synthase-like GNAT family acetyltransferase
MFTIKNIKDAPQHLTRLAQWHQSEWSHLNPGETLEQRIERMQDYLNNNFIPSTFIAEDNAVLGSAAIVQNDMQSRAELSPWLASVYVYKGHRNRGIGEKLVRHIMSCAKDEAYTTLYLFTSDRQRFYERLGWFVFDTQYYHGQQVSLMQVNL